MGIVVAKGATAMPNGARRPHDPEWNPPRGFGDLRASCAGTACAAHLIMLHRCSLLILGCLVAGCVELEGAPSTDDHGSDLGEPVTGGVSPLVAGMPPALCDSAHPIKLTVGMVGIDGNSVHATVGVDLADDLQSVDRDGVPDLNHVAYPIVLNYNPTYDYEGQPNGTPNATRTWTGCVGANVKRVYVESYPRDVTGKTNRTKYGETVYQYLALNGPGAYSVNMRFPLVTEWAAAHGVAGGTGNIFGHVTCNGAPSVPDHGKLRVWSSQPGAACGMRAYSASAEPSASPTYTLTALAGGQCNAPSQPVTVYVRGNCGGHYREVKKLADITAGKTLPRNIELATGIDRGPARRC